MFMMVHSLLQPHAVCSDVIFSQTIRQCYARHVCHVRSERWGTCVCHSYWSLWSWGQLHPFEVHTEWEGD